MRKLVYPNSTKIKQGIIEIFQDINRAQHGGKIRCLTPYTPLRKSFFGLRKGNLDRFNHLTIDNKKLGKTNVDLYKDNNNIWVDTSYEKRLNLKQARKTHFLKKRLHNLKPKSFLKCSLVPELCWAQYVVPLSENSTLLFNEEYSTKKYRDTFISSKKEFVKNSKLNKNKILVNQLPSLSFRLDVFPQFNHSNKDILSKIKIKNSLQYYFLDDKYEITPSKTSRSYVGNPHFHFNCESLSMNLSEKNQGIAISLDNLIKYLKDLIATPLNSKKPIVHDSLYMPFLDIAKGNLIYKSNMANLFDTYRSKDNSKMKQLEECINNLYKPFFSSGDTSLAGSSLDETPPGAKPYGPTSPYGPNKPSGPNNPSGPTPSDKPTTSQHNSGIVSVLIDCCILAELTKNCKEISIVKDVSSALTSSLLSCQTRTKDKPPKNIDKIKIQTNNKPKTNKHKNEFDYKKPYAQYQPTMSKKDNSTQKDKENERGR